MFTNLWSLKRKLDVMSESVSTSGRSRDEKASGPMELSAGTAIALIGICLIGAAMVVFFCIFNYTDILVDNTVLMQEVSVKPSVWDRLWVLFLTFLPGLAAYWLCRFILNKGD